MADYTHFTPKKKERFLELLGEGASVTRAAAAVGIQRRTAYAARAANAEFAAEWDEAIESGSDVIEDEALRRATQGVENDVYFQGQPCGTVRTYSDTLLIFLLKARRPEKFREHAKPEAALPTVPRSLEEKIAKIYGQN